jgi:hypothetical protein
MPKIKYAPSALLFTSFQLDDGKQHTLTIPKGAKPGDVLNYVVKRIIRTEEQLS